MGRTSVGRVEARGGVSQALWLRGDLSRGGETGRRLSSEPGQRGRWRERSGGIWDRCSAVMGFAGGWNVGARRGAGRQESPPCFRVSSRWICELREDQEMTFSEAKLRCQELWREAWVRDKNLNIVSLGQEGISGKRGVEIRREEGSCERPGRGQKAEAAGQDCGWASRCLPGDDSGSQG